jgi:ABC-2 type transport system ATP-binding protein
MKIAAGGIARVKDAMAWAIETRDLTRRFDDFCAVDALNLWVEAGEFYGFLGPNGAGKSTTIKMLTGLLAPTSGSVTLLGEDMSNPARAREVKRRVGVIPENLGLFDNLTAREYLDFIGRMYGVPRPTLRSRCDELLEVMDLAREGKKLTMEFSHGMKKKLAMAAALLPNPELLFLDEPFEGVDAVSSRMLRDTLRRVVKRGATVFLTSHVLEIVEKLCSRVGIIAKGRLTFEAAMADVRQSGSLEDQFIAAVDGPAEASTRLTWLEDAS